MTKDEEQRLWFAYDAAYKRVASGKAGQSNGLEADYGKAYQRLVAAGLAMQLKKKYRAR